MDVDRTGWGAGRQLGHGLNLQRKAERDDGHWGHDGLGDVDEGRDRPLEEVRETRWDIWRGGERKEGDRRKTLSTMFVFTVAAVVAAAEERRRRHRRR